MLRIRSIGPAELPGSAVDVAEVRRLLRTSFSGLRDEEIDGLEAKLRDPLTTRFQTTLLVADDLRGRLRGFALASYAPDVGFWWLDYLVTGSALRGSGVGGALYQRVRELAESTGDAGLFFECLPDDPSACSDPGTAKQNAARLRFYARYGALPLMGTGYETPVRPGDKDLPHLVYDDLGRGRPLARDLCGAIVRAVLERKYPHLVDERYIQDVVASIQDDPVRTRPLPLRPARAVARPRERDPLVLVVNELHEIHHIREQGYVEAPVRVRSILRGLDSLGTLVRREVQEFPEQHITAVHDPALVDYIRRACAEIPEGTSLYPYVFPVRNAARPPRDLQYTAGYYCIDTFTPLNRNAWPAARRAADAALTAASAVRDGARFAYALVRPPGHHAERKLFGGFCYLNNAAIAAESLVHLGRVAILDVDYHHGNGQQDIFYERSDVLTVSLHGHPSHAYPFFTGFEDERGRGAGEGFNLNLALPEGLDGPGYAAALEVALERVRAFAPRFLVVALGLDTAKGDPTGSWNLSPDDFERNGARIRALGLPVIVVQEGGYRTAGLGAAARGFFDGLTGR